MGAQGPEPGKRVLVRMGVREMLGANELLAKLINKVWR